MSYDLYFNRAAPLGNDEFAAFFKNRPNYRLSTDQASYENSDTGVTFVFERKTESAEMDEANDDDDESKHVLAFNLNYFRPHFFGLEALPEVQAVVKHFRFSIHDPQHEGMGDGPFTREGFLRGWNAGNEFGHRAFLEQAAGSPPPHTRPTTELEAIWRWNLNRTQVQAILGEDVFVPQILWFIVDGALQSVVVWTDGIPTLFPTVDMIFVVREELAPRGFFSRKSKPDHCLVPYARAAAVLEPLNQADFALPCHVPTSPSATPDVRRFVQRLKRGRREPERVPFAAVLNQEVMSRCRKRSS